MVVNCYVIDSAYFTNGEESKTDSVYWLILKYRFKSRSSVWFKNPCNCYGWTRLDCIA